MNDDTLAVDVIHKVGPGGIFLGEKHTLEHFRERWMSRLSDVSSFETWQKKGSKSVDKEKEEEPHMKKIVDLDEEGKRAVVKLIEEEVDVSERVGILNQGKGCTTVVFGKHATADGSILMAHNEDGYENEKHPCRHLVYHPRVTYPTGAELKLKAETIAQVPVTYAYYSNDFHKFDQGQVVEGVVDGINEHGVAVCGNTIYTREPVLEKGGISWEEIMKLVMERCKTAKEGVNLIAELQDKYGGTFLSYEHHRYWSGITHVIADPEEAWIIECTPRHWAAKRCPDDGAFFYANEMLLENDYDMASDDLSTYAVEKGWYDPSSGPFSFKRAYGTELGQDRNVGRMKRMDFLLSPKIGTVRVQDLMAFLRDHYEGTVYNYHYPPHAYYAGDLYHTGGHYTICNSTTYDSEVWHLRSYMPIDIGCVMWCCMSSPCENVFQPIWAGARGKTPPEYNVGADELDLHSAWWATQSIRRMVDRDYENRIKLIRDTWQQRETAEFELVAEREVLAMILWQNGQKDEARRLLTDLQNACLHGNYLTALNLLGISPSLGSQLVEKYE